MATVNPNLGADDRDDTNGGRSQKGLADLLLLALEGAEFSALVEEAIGVIRGMLGVGLVCVMEAGEDRGRLVLRAGAGWHEGEVGERSVSTGIDSPVERVNMPGYAMMSKDPVRAEDLRRDPRFGSCPLMREHGVVSGIMTKIDAGGKAYGVLGAHCTEQRFFRVEEAYWLRDVSRGLGGALARKTPSNGSGVQELVHTLEHPNIKTLLDRLSLPSGLAPQHVRILTLLNDGYLVKEIAPKLNCSESNVRKHLKKIYRSLGASGQVAAIARARQLGLFDY